jgi:hypothetical protein
MLQKKYEIIKRANELCESKKAKILRKWRRAFALLHNCTLCQFAYNQLRLQLFAKALEHGGD